jgi:hypothetical protein
MTNADKPYIRVRRTKADLYVPHLPIYVASSVFFRELMIAKRLYSTREEKIWVCRKQSDRRGSERQSFISGGEKGTIEGVKSSKAVGMHEE